MYAEQLPRLAKRARAAGQAVEKPCGQPELSTLNNSRADYVDISMGYGISGELSTLNNSRSGTLNNSREILGISPETRANTGVAGRLSVLPCS